MSTLRGLFDIRPDERRNTYAAFLTFLAITTGHTLLETARDALFLSKMPATRLPWMYLVIVGFALLLSRASRARTDSKMGVIGALVIAAVVTTVFWALLGSKSPSVLYGLYIWSGLFASWVTVQFWTLLGRAHTITQAKRLYGFIGAGAVLGGALGAIAARFAMTTFAPRTSLLLAAALFVVAAFPCASVTVPKAASDALSAREGDEPSSPMKAGIGLLWQNAFARRVLGIVLVSTVTVTIADYLFKSSVAAYAHDDAAKIGAYLSTFYVVTNSLSLVAQLVVAPWVFRTLGIQRALFFFPAFMILAAGGVMVSGGAIGAAVIMKAIDGVVRYSLHRTSTELLLVPIPDGTRERIKPMVDLLGSRGGQAIASLGIVLLVAVWADRPVTLGVIVLTLAIVWLSLVVTIRGLYLDAFRETLRSGGLSGKAELPELDLGALETLFAGLNSDRDMEVLASLDLLAEQHRERLIPALILYHPSRDVVLRALEIFKQMGRADFISIADRLNGHVDRGVAAAALRARTAVAPDRELLVSRLGSTCAQVAVTALVALMARGWISEERASVLLEEALASRSWQTHAELARAIRDAARGSDAALEERFDDLLLRIFDSTPTLRDLATGTDSSRGVPDDMSRLAEAPADVLVLIEVAQAMTVRKSARFLPALVAMLRLHELRASAREALLAIPGALAYLDHAMSDVRVHQAVRVHVPRTMVLFDAREAVPRLERHLVEATDGAMRFKILRALVRLRRGDPSLPIEPRVLHRVAEATLEHAEELRRWRVGLTRGLDEPPSSTAMADPLQAAHHLLLDLLRDKEVHATQRLFLVLELLYNEDFDDVWRGLRSRDAKRRASSLELVENIVRPPLRASVLALVGDDLPSSTPEAPSYEAAIQEILARGGNTMRTLAEYRASELGLVLGPAARDRKSDDSALAMSLGKLLVDRARDLLEGATRAPA